MVMKVRLPLTVNDEKIGTFFLFLAEKGKESTVCDDDDGMCESVRCLGSV